MHFNEACDTISATQYQIPYFDLHCDTIQLLSDRGLWAHSGHVSLGALCNFSKAAQFFAFFEMHPKPCAGGHYPDFERLYAIFVREIRQNNETVLFCRSYDDLLKAGREGKVSAFLSVEGCEILGECLEGLRMAYHSGVRMLTLTWNSENCLSGSNKGGQANGLTECGKKFAEEAFRLGMIIDVSHLSDPGFYDIFELAVGYGKPMVASHSNLRSVCGHRRNLTDDMFRKIIQTDGLAGMNLYADFLSDGQACKADSIYKHLDRFLELGGEKHIALGCDFDGCDALPEGISGLSDMEMLYEGLLKRNYSEELVRGLFWDNAERLIRKVL